MSKFFFVLFALFAILDVFLCGIYLGESNGRKALINLIECFAMTGMAITNWMRWHS